MAASVGKQKSKYDFAQSLGETFTKSLSEDKAPINDPESYKEPERPTSHAVSSKSSEEGLQSNKATDFLKPKSVSSSRKVDKKQLWSEVITKQIKGSQGKTITFSVSYKEDGELEKVINAASKNFGYNRSLYIRSLIYDDYLNNKEEYDEIIEKS